jgi:threonine/homoserine/homoserine lactone efflux protein
MENYLLFIIISALTIASPGQGVVYTVSNTSQYGYKSSVSGILGIIVGVMCSPSAPVRPNKATNTENHT